MAWNDGILNDGINVMEGSDSQAFDASWFMDPNPPVEGEPYTFRITLSPADTVITKVEMNFGDGWDDATESVVFTNGVFEIQDTFQPGMGFWGDWRFTDDSDNVVVMAGPKAPEDD